MDIRTKTARDKLRERREPYWHALGKRSAIGYRALGTGTWIARWREPRGGKKHFQSLGTRPDFSAAVKAAQEWIERMTSGASRAPARGTVRDAVCSYVRHLRSIGRRDTAWEVGQRFRLTIGHTSDFGRMKLEDVARQDVEAWRTALRKTRKARSVNRQTRAVQAALNHAVNEAGHVGNVRAWKLKALVDEEETNTAVFLTAAQRDKLIAAASKEAAVLLTGFAHTGARPSELAHATVADFDPKGGTVTLRHRKGRGAKVRARAVMLSNDGIAFFREQARNKFPTAPLISTAEGTHWSDQGWCRAIELAVEAANKKAKKPEDRIPPGTTCYSLRHSRISELLQVHGIDPVTVAAQTGTSVLMIERSYFKFIASSMRDKLNAVRSVSDRA